MTTFRMKVLYHVTPDTNTGSICDHGISPDWSKGERKVIWLVDRERIAWAVIQMAHRHCIKLSEIAVCRCYVKISQIKHTRFRGVFQSEYIQTANSWSNALSYVEQPPGSGRKDLEQATEDTLENVITVRTLGDAEDIPF